ncbi:hypothetical protein IFM89_011276 [Coptis chinensis]|uniref:DOG1 domain-containing protein n=1 Tax=Coptis chinensis TaxID=261450 RepID=A0A835HDU7_9MAGN|nr:hypothetical protein IFM89_011276 [Coptis chinensis]
MPNQPHSNSNVSNEIAFENFFEVWLVRQQYYLDQLLPFLSSQSNREKELQTLVGQVLAHYQHYYEAKSRSASENVFLIFSPPWFSTFERSFLWIAGFKPGLAFRIVDRSVGGPLWMEIVRRMERPVVDGQIATITNEVEQVVQSLSERLRGLVINADFLRTATARELVDILSPLQAARFLIAFAQLQLKIRAWGLQRDAERRVR